MHCQNELDSARPDNIIFDIQPNHTVGTRRDWTSDASTPAVPTRAHSRGRRLNWTPHDLMGWTAPAPGICVPNCGRC
jgi:hypothetical protein